MLPFVTDRQDKGSRVATKAETSEGGSNEKSRLNAAVPGVGMLRTYKPAWLRFDLVAGIVLAALLVPQGLAYAELAGLPPVTGLYTTIACLVVYALLGPSRVLVLGPDSAVSPLIFAAIVPLMVTDDPATAIALAGMLAIMVGLIEIGLALGKLGFIADLLSKEVQVGYMNGLAIPPSSSASCQFLSFSTQTQTLRTEVENIFSNLEQTQRQATLLVGLGQPVAPAQAATDLKEFPALLVGIVAATVRLGRLDLAADGVEDVRPLPQGGPVPSFRGRSAAA